MNPSRPWQILSVLSLTLASLTATAASLSPRGVPNFYRVNDHVYRGGQPTDEGWRSLAGLGVKTVIDLRRPDEHSTEAEAKAVQAAGMRYVNIPMRGIVAPSDVAISKALALLNSPAAGPVFVHCRRGADRTGTVIACYRIAYDHWQNKRALAEAKSNGRSWTQIGLKSYIRGFTAPVERADTAGSLQAAP